MDDDWEKIADDEPKSAPKIPTDVNKWAGEDEEDPKDSWEDALEEEKQEVREEKPSKPKLSAQERIQAKEKARKEQEEKRRKEIDEDVSLTPEEKLRLKQLEEEEYTRAALDTLGLTSSASIDSSNPKTKEEFTELADVITKKLSTFKSKEEYVPFLDELVRNLLAGLSSTSMRKIKTSVDNLILEKQKLEKGDKPKKKTTATKTKARLRVEDDDDYASRATLGQAGAFEDDDYDDFM